MTCKARVIGDQYMCDRCGLQWDLNDPDRPECISNAKAADRVFKKHCTSNKKRQGVQAKRAYTNCYIFGD